MQNALEAEVQRLKAENERLETTASGCYQNSGPQSREPAPPGRCKKRKRPPQVRRRPDHSTLARSRAGSFGQASYAASSCVRSNSSARSRPSATTANSQTDASNLAITSSASAFPPRTFASRISAGTPLVASSLSGSVSRTSISECIRASKPKISDKTFAFAEAATLTASCAYASRRSSRGLALLPYRNRMRRT